MSLLNRMNDVGFLLTKKALKNKTFEEFKKDNTSKEKPLIDK